jgi:hypothetical protein
MMMRAGLVLTLAAVFALGACSSATVGVTPTSAPPAPGLSVTTQRIEAQAGIAVAQGIQVASLFTALLKQLPLGGGSLPTGACEDGIESTIKVLNPEQLQVNVNAFYEKSCKTIFIRAILKTTYFPSGTLEIAGTSTTYSPSGKAVAFGTISTNGTALSTGVNAVTTGTISQTPTGPAELSFGLSCTLAATNDCGFGGLVPAASSQQSLGVTATLDGFTGSGTVKNGTATVAAFTGKPGGLKLSQGSGNTWQIHGGTPVASLAGTFDETVDAKGLNASGSENLQDATAGAAVALDFGTRTGIARGVVNGLSPAKSYASFSANAAGTGAIDYSDGSSGQILLFIITS